MKKQQQTHRQIQALFSVLSDSLNDIGVIQTINIINKTNDEEELTSLIHEMDERRKVIAGAPSA